MPDVALAPGMRLHCYDTLMAEADEDYVWPGFDENTASALCYTSGTTGRPKGVLYSHRSTVLHAYAVALPDVLGMHATDRILPVVPMFHVNAWGIPYATALTGAALVLPGRHLDGASMAALLNAEHVTTTCGVPTVWLGLLQHLRSSGDAAAHREAHHDRRVRRAAAADRGVPRRVRRRGGAWLGHDRTEPGRHLQRAEAGAGGAGEGRGGAAHAEAGPHPARHRHEDRRWRRPRTAVGRRGVRRPDGARAVGRSAYYGEAPGSAVDADGWFATGDVATIDPDGFMEITDRSKDVIKSGGEWISSITLENIAVSHPDVLEAAVIAARHAKWDERPLLLVVPRPGHTIDPASVLQIYEGKVAKWWLPDAVVVVAGVAAHRDGQAAEDGAAGAVQGLPGFAILTHRCRRAICHCERSEAISRKVRTSLAGDCFATLAMTLEGRPLKSQRITSPHKCRIAGGMPARNAGQGCRSSGLPGRPADGDLGMAVRTRGGRTPP